MKRAKDTRIGEGKGKEGKRRDGGVKVISGRGEGKEKMCRKW